MSHSDLIIALPPGTVIQQYKIVANIGYGGFGIVYQGEHPKLGNVAIKEYLPTELAVRKGLDVYPISESSRWDFEFGLKKFEEEARQLLNFNHRNIVRCRDYVEANGTAYLIMDYEVGLNLGELLLQRELQKNPFSEGEIHRIIVPVLGGLRIVHDHGVLHRDIKPQNIFIRRKTEEPILIDFGAAKQNYSEKTKSTYMAHTPGYAPIEQIEEGDLGPWTDIYSLGAVIWRIVTGNNPDSVEKRVFAKLKGDPDHIDSELRKAQGKFSPILLTIVSKCMALAPEERFKTVAELLDAISDKKPTISFPPISPTNEAKPAGWNIRIIALGILLLAGIVLSIPFAIERYQNYVETQEQQVLAEQETALLANRDRLIEQLLTQFDLEGSIIESRVDSGLGDGKDNAQIIQEFRLLAEEQSRQVDIARIMAELSIPYPEAEEALVEGENLGLSPTEIIENLESDRQARLALIERDEARRIKLLEQSAGLNEKLQNWNPSAGSKGRQGEDGQNGNDGEWGDDYSSISSRRDGESGSDGVNGSVGGIGGNGTLGRTMLIVFEEIVFETIPSITKTFVYGDNDIVEEFTWSMESPLVIYAFGGSGGAGGQGGSGGTGGEGGWGGEGADVNSARGDGGNGGNGGDGGNGGRGGNGGLGGNGGTVTIRITGSATFIDTLRNRLIIDSSGGDGGQAGRGGTGNLEGIGGEEGIGAFGYTSSGRLFARREGYLGNDGQSGTNGLLGNLGVNGQDGDVFFEVTEI